MSYIYSSFRPENTAPKGAKKIVVYDENNNKISTVPLGRLSPIKKEKLYSFGLVSDIHLYYTNTEWKPDEKFRHALDYFKENNCVMCIQCGDITQTGFYSRITNTLDDGTVEYNYIFVELDDPNSQMNVYKTIREEYADTLPVYGICGNHESYYSKNVSNHPDDVEAVMGKRELSFTISSAETSDKNIQMSVVGNDVFILLGQPSGSVVMSATDFDWFREILEVNKDRRCFVFVHSYIENIDGDSKNDDSGDALDVQTNSIFDMWGATNKKNFINLLKTYNNVILFHGHSHRKLKYQENDMNANYTVKNGFKSVHIPSLSVPRDIKIERAEDGTITYKSVDDRAGSEGYIVDVYDDCIVLNGMDFVNNECIPVGTYKIDTNY